MSIVRISHDKEKPYVILNRSTLQDPMMSWEAKGLWAYLLSLPDNWEVSVTHLSSVYQGSKRGGKRDRIYALLKELQELGYVIATQKQAKKGQFGHMDYTVYESKQPVSSNEKRPDPVKPKLKKKVPYTDKPYTAEPVTVNPTQTINNDKEEIYKENDNNVNDDRSFEKGDSIVSFDPNTYRLPDGSPLSLQMRRAIAKYSQEDLYKLRANVAYFEDQVRKGNKPKDTYEKWLQACIKNDYAAKQNNTQQNNLYARFVKEEYNLRGLIILKTVVQLKSSENEPPQSISLSLPAETFSAILDKFIKNSEEWK